MLNILPGVQVPDVQSAPTAQTLEAAVPHWQASPDTGPSEVQAKKSIFLIFFLENTNVMELNY